MDNAGGLIVILSAPSAERPSFIAPANAGADVSFNLIVNDGLETSLPSSVTVTVVENTAPVADAGADQSRAEGNTVTLNAGASSDPDGDGLTFSWAQVSGPIVELSDTTLPFPSFLAPVVGSDGATIIFELTVNDDDGFNPLSSTDTVTVNIVNENDPPSCALAHASTDNLWPPNHRLREVSIGGVEDPETGVVGITLTITAIRQDEPVDGTGDGDTSPDAVIQLDGLDIQRALLRAERDGSRNGRVYKIDFSASDGEEACSGSVVVGVPKNRKSSAVDDGTTFNSLEK